MEINNDVDECALMCYATAAVDEGCIITQIWDTVRALVSDEYLKHGWIFFELFGVWLATVENCKGQQPTYVELWKLALSQRE
jgi:hypothetical protein